ncbi:MAG: efflux RND transporter periplasmic adaptor subunit [Rhizobium sp.]|nr:efflux RND transporter periplasmic adaptor subunit [Rhizobium sp.]
MKTHPLATPLAATIAVLLAACSPDAPPAATHRPVRAVELHYQANSETSRYFGSIQSRYESDHSFRVGGKVVERRVDVGQRVRSGDILGVIDATDLRLAEDAAQRQWEAASVRATQAESDWYRLQALKSDGSVSASEEERARSASETARAAAKAEARRLEIARNQVEYATLRASRDGVVTAVRFEVGQVMGVGQPALAIADEGQAEIVVDVPEGHLDAFKKATFRASLTTAPDETFEVELREMAAQASPQTRTYRARLVAGPGARLPLGASATLVAKSVASGPSVAAIPSGALTQADGKPALWIARPVEGEPSVARVELVLVEVHGYRNERVLVEGPEEGALVVAAGVHKMSPELLVSLSAASAEPGSHERSKQ